MTKIEMHCQASRDGEECHLGRACPQAIDGEPAKTGRHCPLDRGDFYADGLEHMEWPETAP